MRTKIIIFTLICLLGGILFSLMKMAWPRGSWVNLKTISTQQLEQALDTNTGSWKEHSDSTISLTMPIYLSRFNNISATELTQKDEMVANYFRSSNGTSGEGRSYWIILLNPQHDTATQDIEQWIRKNKLNINTENSEELPIQQVTIGGRTGYRIKKFIENGTPRGERIYFMTREGIRAIGFWVWGENNEQAAKDYRVYQQILSTLRFKEQYE